MTKPTNYTPFKFIENLINVNIQSAPKQSSPFTPGKLHKAMKGNKAITWWLRFKTTVVHKHPAK